MNRGILDVRLPAVLFILLLGSVAFIRAENLSVVAEQVSNKVPCSSCPLSSSSTAQVLNTTILEGEEKNRAVATALSSEDYKNVKKLFPESVYEPSVENATAGIVNLELNGTEYEVSAVFVPFEAAAGLKAGIVFSVIKGHTMAIGAIVNLQFETPIFAAMSMDGKALEIPLAQGIPCSSCSSCGSGVSPMVDECAGDIDCWDLYGLDYCCVDGHCVYCMGECVSDYDCYLLYGEGWCCSGGQCQVCPPPSGCKVMNENCLSVHTAACSGFYAVCLIGCIIQGNPFCPILCYAAFLICLGLAYYDCCLEWW